MSQSQKPLTKTSRRKRPFSLTTPRSFQSIVELINPLFLHQFEMQHAFNSKESSHHNSSQVYYQKKIGTIVTLSFQLNTFIDDLHRECFKCPCNLDWVQAERNCKY
jgi:hypothetical protein